MGLTFKENVPDMSNSKAIDVVRQLASYGLNVKIVDPFVDKAELAEELALEITELKDVQEADCLIFLVAHSCFASLQPDELGQMYRSERGKSIPVLIDVKNIFEKSQMEKAGYLYWSL